MNPLTVHRWQRTRALLSFFAALICPAVFKELTE